METDAKKTEQSQPSPADAGAQTDAPTSAARQTSEQPSEEVS